MAIVQRAPADKPGDEIVSSILVSPPSQIHRGRQEINYHSTDRLIKQGAIIDSSFVQPGTVAEISDKVGSKRGMVIGFSVQVQADPRNISKSTNVSVEVVK